MGYHLIGSRSSGRWKKEFVLTESMDLFILKIHTYCFWTREATLTKVHEMIFPSKEAAHAFIQKL